MADIEITDEASLEAWLKTRPRRDAEIIAFRADLRAFPFWIRQEGEPASNEPKPTTLPLLQLILAKFFSQKSTSKLYLLNNYPKLSKSSPAFAPCMAMSASAAENAASAAAYAAEAAIDSTDVSAKAMHGVMAAVNRAQFFSEIASEMERSSWQAISADAIALYTGADHSRLPLWPTPAPDWFTAADRETRAIWAKDPPTWAFWEKWWDGVISGDMPFPPELLRDVALIEDDIWQAGPREVAAAIDKLISARALDMTDNGESVEINPETGRLRLVAADTLPPDIERYARRKMAKALALFEGELSNQYRPLDAPLRTIRAALGDIENLPVELFDACASASRMTAILVETQSIPAPEQDPLIGEFVASLRETAADILAADTKTQDILTKRKAVMGNDTLIAHSGDINIVVGQIVVVSEGALQRMLPENADAALNPNAHPEERSVGAYKLAGRIFRIAGWAIAAPIGVLGAVGAAIDGSYAIMALVSSPQFHAVLAWCLKYIGLG